METRRMKWQWGMMETKSPTIGMKMRELRRMKRRWNVLYWCYSICYVKCSKELFNSHTKHSNEPVQRYILCELAAWNCSGDERLPKSYFLELFCSCILSLLLCFVSWQWSRPVFTRYCHAPLQGGGAFTVNLLLSWLNTTNMFFTLTVDYVDCCNLSPILSGSTHEHYHEFMQVHHVCPCSFLCKFPFPWGREGGAIIAKYGYFSSYVQLPKIYGHIHVRISAVGLHLTLYC